MADTPYSICSRALVRIGANAIASFGDATSATTEQTVAGEEYEPAVKNALSTFPWRFNAKMGTLTQLAEEPLERWTYYYQAPSDAIDVRAVLFGGVPIPFDRYGNKIACDYTGTLVCEYGYRAGEVYFPAYFIEALTKTLEAVFCQSIRRDASVADELRKQADKLWIIARHRDSVQQTNRRLPTSNLIRIRG